MKSSTLKDIAKKLNLSVATVSRAVNNKEYVKEETRKVIGEFGRTHFILGADCTLATEQDMNLLKAAVEAARE